jgi:hypothetical protein
MLSQLYPGSEVVVCAPAEQLASATLLITEVHSQNTNYIYTARRDCPGGTRVYSGGGFFHVRYGPPDLLSGYQTVYASMPTGNGWFFGANAYGLTEDLTYDVRCLPTSQVPTVVSVTRNFPVSAAGLISGSAFCPVPLHAYSGGAWWHTDDSTLPADVGALSASEPSGYATAWHAEGWGYSADAVLSVTVRCTSG